MVRPAIATAGAALNSPAKRLGDRLSESSAKATTRLPPARPLTSRMMTSCTRPPPTRGACRRSRSDRLRSVAWDFSTEPEFQAKLDWMRQLVRGQIWPLETLLEARAWEGVNRALGPIQNQANAEGLWAAHLDPALGGQGFRRDKKGLMNESLGSTQS